MIRLTQELVEIKSETNFSNNREIVNYLCSFFSEIGLKPVKQKIQNNLYNLIVLGKGDMLINGHMDTVILGEKWTKKQGQVEDGKIYGRGTSDTKGNFACFLAALRNNPTENITCTFSAVEEGSFLGIETVMQKKQANFPKIKYGVTLEPTDGRLCNLSKGIFGFEVNSYGKTAHGSTPHLGENAIEKLSKLIVRFEEYKGRLSKKTYKNLDFPTINIGQIEGGKQINVVPEHAKILVERRLLPNENEDKVVKEFTDFCKGFEVKNIFRIYPFETSENSNLIKLFKELTGQSKVYPSIGSNEASVFVRNGMDGLVYGPGRGDQAHKRDEFIEIKEMEKSKKVFDKLIKKVEGNQLV